MEIVPSHCVIRSRVWNALKSGGWIYHPNEERDHPGSRRWTDLGECRKLQLQHIIQSFDLTCGAEDALRFTQSCPGAKELKTANFEEVSKCFWAETLEELGIPQEKDAVWQFICLISDNDSMLSE